MSKRNRVRDEVEKTMSLLDRLENLEAGPYFYTRVAAKLRSREREEQIRQPVFWGAGVLKPALLTLLLAVNFISAGLFLLKPGDTGVTGETYRSHAAQLAGEYWPSQDSYVVSVTEKMTGENE